MNKNNIDIVPPAAISCLLHAALAGSQAAHAGAAGIDDAERQSRIDFARHAISDAYAALKELNGTTDQFFCPALTAAIESAEIEIAWAANAPGRPRNYGAARRVTEALYPAPARPEAEAETLYDTIDGELADAEIIVSADAQGM